VHGHQAHALGAFLDQRRFGQHARVGVAFELLDYYDTARGISAMMRTTAFPASIVVQMLASGAISKRGGVLQERDVPADLFLEEVEKRGIKIDYAME
jgi:saccharopine dehydrogenase-like NADP-dependent oxidoreductase